MAANNKRLKKSLQKRKQQRIKRAWRNLFVKDGLLEKEL